MKILDTVWMVTLPQEQGVVYGIGTSAQEAWDRALETFHNVLPGKNGPAEYTKKAMQKAGYRARKLAIASLTPGEKDLSPVYFLIKAILEGAVPSDRKGLHYCPCTCNHCVALKRMAEQYRDQLLM